MQRHAFLIMAHNNWYTLERLIKLLDEPWIDIYLHIDRKATDFCRDKYLNSTSNAHIILTKRHNVTWGNESQIKAEMALFKTAYKRGPYHYYHFLSGTDLPLVSTQAIYDFFEDKECNYLYSECDVSPYEWRLKKYINIFRSKYLPDYLKKKLNILSEILQYKLKTDRLIWLKSQYPILGKGHNWCDLTQPAVEKLVKAEKHIKKFTRYTHCSDEMYKQIILYNQPPESVGQISDTDIRYIDWRAEGNHPRTLTVHDYETLISLPSHYIFARKFDERTDREIIDRIYSHLSKADNGR